MGILSFLLTKRKVIPVTFLFQGEKERLWLRKTAWQRGLIFQIEVGSESGFSDPALEKPVIRPSGGETKAQGGVWSLAGRVKNAQQIAHWLKGKGSYGEYLTDYVLDHGDIRGAMRLSATCTFR